MSLTNILQAVLRGLAQIFLLRTATAGLLVLCGLWLASPVLGAAALVGSALGAGLAAGLGRPGAEVRQGLHGYNGALAAVALQVLYAPAAWALAAAVVAVTLAGLLLLDRNRWPVPGYTVPFLLVVWAVMSLASLLGLSPAVPSAPPDAAALELGHGLLHGLGQVVFVQSVPAALCAVLAIAVESPRLALQVLAASALGLALGTLAQMPDHALAAGMAGFNAVLCALALGRHCAWLPTLGAAAAATGLSLAAQRAGIPVLTGPFILCSWAVLWGTRHKR
jgi:urea transporter